MTLQVLGNTINDLFTSYNNYAISKGFKLKVLKNNLRNIRNKRSKLNENYQFKCFCGKDKNKRNFLRTKRKKFLDSVIIK